MEKQVTQEEGDELPSTQPLDVMPKQSSQLDDADAVAWGLLLPASNKLPVFRLIKDSYEIGRHPNCDLEFKEGMFSEKAHFHALSKIHVTITRKDNVTILEDFSSNGTFINEIRIIAKPKKVILQHNDKIGLAHKNFCAFVYVDLTKDQPECGYPQVVMDKYNICQFLGQGASGDVRLVFEKGTCQRYALKIINKRVNVSRGMNTNNSVQNEIKILKSVDHPCIVKVKDSMDFEDRTFILMEYMEGGTLASRVHVGAALSESVAKLVFYQLLLAVQYLHSMKIAHRDLKPENILLQSISEETLVKVSDFGLSKQVSQDPLMSMCGTLQYLAPEMVRGRGKEEYTPQVDVWSLGVILYQSLVGRLPFNSDRTDMTLGEQITNGSYNLSDRRWLRVSADARAIVSAMLTVYPQERPTIQEVFTCRWLQDELMLGKVRKLTGITDLPKVNHSSCRIRSFEMVAQAEKQPEQPEPKRIRKCIDTPPSSTEDTKDAVSSSPNRANNDAENGSASTSTPPIKQLKAMSFRTRQI